MPAETLEGRYRELCATPSDINEHLPTFVRTVEELDARLVIELGTRTGVSTIAWLYALQGRGTLWSVDIDDAPPIGAFPHWTFLRGSDIDAETYRLLPADADVVFVDTSHTFEHTIAELSLYRWLVRPGGRILLHDTELRYPEGVTGRPYPVRRAIEEFCTVEGLAWENDPRCWGLGTILIP